MEMLVTAGHWRGKTDTEPNEGIHVFENPFSKFFVTFPAVEFRQIQKMKAGCTNEGILGRKRFLGHGCVTLSRTLVVNQSRPESIEIRIHFYALRSNEDFSV